MLTKGHVRLLSIAAVLLSAGTPALALNPQPLPPVYRSAPNAVSHSAGSAVEAQNVPRNARSRLHCFTKQVGDGRKAPPMLVCP